jgi:transcriptional regulator with XRE-family HTH domain
MVGEMIRKLRTQKGWRQSELAERMGISRQALSNYELNRRDVDNDLLKRFAEIFNVPVDFILQVEIKNVSLEELEKIFEYEIDISLDEFEKKHKLLVDGKILNRKEIQAILAFIRFHRSQ